MRRIIAVVYTGIGWFKRDMGAKINATQPDIDYITLKKKSRSYKRLMQGLPNNWYGYIRGFCKARHGPSPGLWGESLLT